MNMPRVSQYMDRNLQTLKPDTDLLAAVDFLLEHHVTGAPVVNEAGEVVGIISEKDLLRLLAAGVDNQLPKGTVADFMTKNPRTVSANMNIFFCAGMFLGDYVRRYPVVDNGKLVGAITRFDILRAVREIGRQMGS
ncbi:MAG: CBS domain-containing protein [Deltaproteobacteria bacterium]|nr:CBS domain-containing protein [Deltaproteobacteria bacterium]